LNTFILMVRGQIKLHRYGVFEFNDGK